MAMEVRSFAILAKVMGVKTIDTGTMVILVPARHAVIKRTVLN
jgi:hypothetical protein